MAINHYDWEVGQPPPALKRHSQIKHEIIRDYLAAYINTLVRPAYDQLRLTLIDGFAGGGEYRLEDTNEVVPGSPLILIDVAKESAANINLDRKKPFHLEAHFYFVEKRKNNFHYLNTCLDTRGHKDDPRIHRINGAFQDHEDKIIQDIRSRGRACRSIFILDQYGYSQVPTDQIKKILHHLPKSEIIMTFNVDSLINYLNNKNWQQFCNSINAPEIRNLDINSLRRKNKSIRRFIQEYLIRHLAKACGARFFTPFFIQNSDGHGEYWLIHFSQHAKARDVMTSIHWAKNNYFVSYGHPGIDCDGITNFQALGFSDHIERLENSNHQFGFDSPNECIRNLIEDIPRILDANGKILRAEEFYNFTANHTPASRKIINDAFSQLLQEKEIIICDEKGNPRRSARKIKENYTIEISRQFNLYT